MHCVLCNVIYESITYNVFYALYSVHQSHSLELYAWYYMNGIPCIVFYAFHYISHISFALLSMHFHRATIAT